MARRRFKFTLQPVLDKEIAARDELAIELNGLEEERDRLEEELKEHRQIVAEVTQRIQTERDNLVSKRDSGELIQLSQRINHFRGHLAALQQQEQERLEKIREVEGLIRVKRKQLENIFDQITTYERLRDKQEEEFRKALLSEEEKERDEDSILRWSWRDDDN